MIIIITFVVLAIAGAAFFVWGRKDESSKQSTQSNTTSTTKPKVVEKSEVVPESILEVELLLQRTGDEELLPGETALTFKQYMKSRLNDFDCDFTESPAAGFTISKISPRFVAGRISCLGGASTVWYLTTAGWEELGFQSQVPCSKLSEYAIPSDFLSECYDDTSPNEEVVANPNGPLN